MILLLVLVSGFAYLCASRKNQLEYQLAEALQQLSRSEQDAKSKDAVAVALTCEKEALRDLSLVLSQRNEELEGRLAEADADLRRMVLELEGMQIKELQMNKLTSNALAGHAEMIAELKATLQAAETECCWRLAENRAKDGTVLALTKEKEELQREVLVVSQGRDELEGRLKEAEVKLARRTIAPHEIWQRVVVLKARLEVTEAENRALAKEKDNLKATQERYELMILELKDRVSEYHRRVNEDNCFDEPSAASGHHPSYDYYPPWYHSTVTQTPGPVHRRWYTEG